MRATPRAPASVGFDAAEVPPRLLAKLRAACLALPGTHEESAWVGTRWKVRERTFAHVLTIYAGRPRAYARAAKSDGPLVVMTVRAGATAHRALCALGSPFFDAPWGTKWGTRVVGVTLKGRIDWQTVRALLVQSHRLLDSA